MLAPLGSTYPGHPVHVCHHKGTAKPKTTGKPCAAALPAWLTHRSLRPLAAAPWRMLRSRPLCAAQQDNASQGYGVSVDEECMMRIAESLPPEDRSKALKLWEENKRMRTKLAILEGMSELPPRQRIRALELLRENQSLRNHTGSLLPTWEDLKGTVTSLMEAEEEALAASTTGSTGSSTSSSSGAGPSIADLLADGSPLDAGGVGAAEEEEPEAVYDPSWRFWDTGLSSAGVQGLITSDAALSLALNKAEAMVQTRDVDDILNNYWSAQLNITPPPMVEQQQQQQQQQPLMAASSTADMESAAASAGAPPEAQSPPQEVPVAARAPVAAASAQQPPELELEGAGGGLTGGRGVMAAAAGLGAGMLALAVGLEAATAMEIMATTALVTSAGSLLGSNEAATVLRRRGAGAPALVAIATTLNAADTLSKTLDQALESERAKTMARAADSAAKMIAVVGKNAVSGVAGSVKGSPEAPVEAERPEIVMRSAGRAVAAASSVVETAEEAMAGAEEADVEDYSAADDALQIDEEVEPPANSCLVVFSVEKEVPEGSCLKVVGTEDELGAWDGSLGAWDGSQGLALHLKGKSTWIGAATVPLGASVEFTLATHLAEDEGGDVAWESVLGGSRTLQADASVAFVRCEWGNPESTEAELGDAAMDQAEAALQSIEDAKNGVFAPEAGSGATSAIPPVMASAEVAGALEEALKLSTSAEEEKLEAPEGDILAVREDRPAAETPPEDSAVLGPEMAAASLAKDEQPGSTGAAEEEEGSVSKALAAVEPDAAQVALPGTKESAASDTTSAVEDVLAETLPVVTPSEAAQAAAADISGSVGIGVPEDTAKTAVGDTTEAVEAAAADLSGSVGIGVPEDTAKTAGGDTTEAVEAAAADISGSVGIGIPEGTAKTAVSDTTEAVEAAAADTPGSVGVDILEGTAMTAVGDTTEAVEAAAADTPGSVGVDILEGTAMTAVSDTNEAVEAALAEADTTSTPYEMVEAVESANPPGSVRIDEGTNKSAVSDTTIAVEAVLLAEADTMSAPIEAAEASAADVFEPGVAVPEEAVKADANDTNEAVEAVLAEADNTITSRKAIKAAEVNPPGSVETVDLVENEKIAESVVRAEESISQADLGSSSGATEIPAVQVGPTEPGAASADAKPAGGETTSAYVPSSATGIGTTGVEKEQEQRDSLNASTCAEDTTSQADDDSSLLRSEQSLPALPTEDESGNQNEELRRNAEAQGTAAQLLKQDAEAEAEAGAEAPDVNAQADNQETLPAAEQSAGVAGDMGPMYSVGLAPETVEPRHGASCDASDSLPEDALAKGSAVMMDENAEEKGGARATVEEAAATPASPGPAEDAAAMAVMAEAAALPEAAVKADSQSDTSLTSVEDAESDADVQFDAEMGDVLAEEELVASVSPMLPRIDSMVPNRSPGELEDTNAFAMFLDALAAPPAQPAEASVAGAKTDEKAAGEVVAGSPATTARVVFAVKQELEFGQGMEVVGSCVELGNWDITAQAVVMKWNEGHLWVGEATVPCGIHEFKFVVTDGCSGNALYWETSGASNRIMQVPEGASTIFTQGEFGHMDESNVSVDDDLDARIAAAIA